MELEHGAWIEFESNWLAGTGRLFDRLLDAVPWRAERRLMYDRIVDVPRLVAFYEEGEALPDPVLEEVRETLCRLYRDERAPFCTTGICLYRTGDDSVAWHGDTIGRRSGDDTLVAIVSLGAPRRFPAPTEGRRPGAPVQSRPRRPAGDGRQLPAHLGALGAEDVAPAPVPVSACSSGRPGSGELLRRPGLRWGRKPVCWRTRQWNIVAATRPQGRGGETMAQSAGLHEPERAAFARGHRPAPGHRVDPGGARGGRLVRPAGGGHVRRRVWPRCWPTTAMRRRSTRP